MRPPKIAVKVAIVENVNLITYSVYIIQCITREHEKAPKEHGRMRRNLEEWAFTGNVVVRAEEA